MNARSLVIDSTVYHRTKPELGRGKVITITKGKYNLSRAFIVTWTTGENSTHPASDLRATPIGTKPGCFFKTKL